MVAGRRMPTVEELGPEYKKIESSEIERILGLHERLLASKKGGSRASLKFVDLSHHDLSRRNLAGADLTGARLSGANRNESRL